MRTSQSSVPIVGLPSLSALRNKSFSNLRAILMSPSAVPHVAKQGRQSDTEIVTTATGPHAKCFLQYAPSVAKIPKYPLNLVLVDQCIVAIATAKSDRVDSAVLNLKSIHRLECRAYVCFSQDVLCRWKFRYVKVNPKTRYCGAFKGWYR